MSTVILKSPAKINLTLDVLGKDQRTGKHFVNTILYRDDRFFDEIELKPLSGQQNILYCLDQSVPTDDSNTILRAMKLLGIVGYQITLTKNIPTGGGLGGGSSNAGVILKHFAEQKGIPEFHLLEMARSIGADVPFFILDDNLAYCEGFGDLIVQSWTISPLNIEYVPTGISVSTAQAYDEIDLSECGMSSAKTEALLHELNLNLPRLPPTHLLHNDFEHSFFREHPEWRDKGHLAGSGGTLWKLKD
jgi:4-diphosphocytidyl-2-C-methyl-D-erythritol kinase